MAMTDDTKTASDIEVVDVVELFGLDQSDDSAPSDFASYDAEITLTEEDILKACPMEAIQDKPYVTMLPKTRPSAEYLRFEFALRMGKNEEESVDEIDLSTFVPSRRRNFESWLRTFPPPRETRIERQFVQGTEILWVYWPGIPRETKKLLFYTHGGAYTSGHAKQGCAQLALLCKLIGCVAVSVDYHRPPEHPMPHAVDECVEVYKWLLTEKGYPASSIAFLGESAGGGLNLLCLQRIRDLGLELPSCSWLCSPWTSLENKTNSWLRNNEFDAMLSGKSSKIISHFVVGKLKLDGTESGQPYVALDDPRVSPMNGDFAGLPPVYITVGASEMILDDALLIADGMASAGVDVQVVISPFLCHVAEFGVGLFPEASEGNCLAAQFFLRHMKSA